MLKHNEIIDEVAQRNFDLDCDEMEKEVLKAEEEQEKKDILVFEEVKNILNDQDKIDQLIKYMEDDLYNYNFEIVDNYPKKLKNKRDWYNTWMTEIYVDQHCICEDSYYGTIYIKLPNNKYFAFDFNC